MASTEPATTGEGVVKLIAEPVNLGERCRLWWTPLKAEQSFVITFSLGSWTLTTPRIYPRTTGTYFYDGTLLPLAVAEQFPSRSAQMVARMFIYEGTTIIGSSVTAFAVTVPQNQDTCPSVTATLHPECVPFPGLYVQRLGKVRVETTVTDPLGATITGLQILVDGTACSGDISDALQKAGTVPVTVKATNTRGYSGTWTGEITVLPYDSPRLTGSVYRCLSDGTPDASGTFLGVQLSPLYSPVDGYNSGTLRWRLKSSGEYGLWQELNLSDGGVISGVTVEKDQAYMVQISLTDIAGSKAELTAAIAVEQVYLHRTPNAMGLGGYAQGEQLLDVHWDVQARKGLNGAYIRTLMPVNRTFSVKMSGSGQTNTLFLLSGSAQGVITLTGGKAAWSGTAGVSVSRGEEALTVVLPSGGSRVLLLSPDPIEI